MKKDLQLTFGPIHSRRFGISLGIDLSPTKKQCNFDCLYCELDPAKTVEIQDEIIEVDKYIKAVQVAIDKEDKIDVITITANGEPTLYPHLEELINKLNEIKGDTKLMILSNSGLIYKNSIFKALQRLDVVKLSLDCATKECFKKLDRIDNSIDYQKIIDGIIAFSKVYSGDLIMEVLFVDTLNNKDNEIDAIYEILKQINPDRVDIGTIDRPPAYDVKPITYEELQQIASKFEGLNVAIAHRKKVELHSSYSDEEILNTLDKRPLSDDDISNLFDKDSQTRFKVLKNEGKIIETKQAGMVFYKKNDIDLSKYKKCRNCYYEVHIGIRKCPHCGILNPTITQKEIWYIMAGILLVMGIYTYIIR
jgi:wyosine [tRNA(Phe)-imidazoG37] synthetase (radical SAM superfamily)